MRRELLLAILLLAFGAPVAARADFSASPNFSAAEVEMIARVPMLSDLVRDDPWLVKLVLDMASRADAGAENPTARDAQGIVNWNELLRKAKKRKEQQGATSDPDMARSALGILDASDWIRKAKTKKENETVN